jgi:hypothetical protein
MTMKRVIVFSNMLLENAHEVIGMTIKSTTGNQVPDMEVP